MGSAGLPFKLHLSLTVADRRTPDPLHGRRRGKARATRVGHHISCYRDGPGAPSTSWGVETRTRPPSGPTGACWQRPLEGGVDRKVQ
jgi:hypothetical protein